MHFAAIASAITPKIAVATLVLHLIYGATLGGLMAWHQSKTAAASMNASPSSHAWGRGTPHRTLHDIPLPHQLDRCRYRRSTLVAMGSLSGMKTVSWILLALRRGKLSAPTLDLYYLDRRHWDRWAALGGVYRDTLTIVRTLADLWPQRAPGTPLRVGVC